MGLTPVAALDASWRTRHRVGGDHPRL